MGYRDDRDALEHQVKLLEQELAPIREELAELDQQREALQRELAQNRRTLRLRQFVALLIGSRRRGRGAAQ